MLNGPEISNFTKFLYAVLYAEWIAEILPSLRRWRFFREMEMITEKIKPVALNKTNINYIFFGGTKSRRYY